MTDPRYPLGWVAIGLHRFPVRSVRLTGGSIRVVYELAGPLPPVRGHVTVYGEEGQGVWQGHEAAYPAIPEDSVWLCNYDMTITHVGTWDTLADWTAGPIGSA